MGIAQHTRVLAVAVRVSDLTAVSIFAVEFMASQPTPWSQLQVKLFLCV
jgi:hypothetical protein